MGLQMFRRVLREKVVLPDVQKKGTAAPPPLRLRGFLKSRQLRQGQVRDAPREVDKADCTTPEDRAAIQRAPASGKQAREAETAQTGTRPVRPVQENTAVLPGSFRQKAVQPMQSKAERPAQEFPPTDKFDAGRIKTKDACVTRRAIGPARDRQSSPVKNAAPSDQRSPHPVKRILQEQPQKDIDWSGDQRQRREALRRRASLQKGAGLSANGLRDSAFASNRRSRELSSEKKAVDWSGPEPRKAARPLGAILQARKDSIRAARSAAQAAGAAQDSESLADKLTAAATRATITALLPGGGSLLTVLLMLCLLGALLLSPMGVLFSGEDAGAGLTMASATRETDQDYETRLQELQADNPHDLLELSGSRAPWPEVLAVYAVRAVADGQEVVTMDEEKKELLRQIFWAMHTIDYSLTTDDSGDEPVTTLHITVSHRTTEEMADVYGFTPDQRQQLTELLSDECRELWNELLYGGGDIVSVALSQVGNVGGEPYWRWYGFDHRVDWCAIFVSWCADQCGYLDAGVLPRFAGCVQGVQWFQARGLWQDRSYTPSPGDVIFFDWDFAGEGQDGIPDHVGIVEKVQNSRVYTIEGNSGDSCCQRSYPVGYHEIFGYGTLPS